MDDEQILALLLQHDEDGLQAIVTRYGKRLHALAAGIVGQQTAEECVNDALLQAWNAIPPQNPTHLCAYFCKLTRNLALNRYAESTAQKRGGSVVTASFDELAECLPAENDPATAAEQALLEQAISRFLRKQSAPARNVFLARYFYAMTLHEIAARFSMREGAVKSSLHRTREKLRDFLKQEAFL